MLDFPSPTVPRAYPYGIYDLAHNTGFVNVGTDYDTGAFAVASIRGWWRAEGWWLHPDAHTLLTTARFTANGTTRFARIICKAYFFTMSYVAANRCLSLSRATKRE